MIKRNSFFAKLPKLIVEFQNKGIFPKIIISFSAIQAIANILVPSNVKPGNQSTI